MNKYNILNEADSILEDFLSRKPDTINSSDWELAQRETKDLMVETQRLEKLLQDAYLRAVEMEEWRKALILYQEFMGKPHLRGINPLVYELSECEENEREFIAEAKTFIAEANCMLIW